MIYVRFTGLAKMTEYLVKKGEVHSWLIENVGERGTDWHWHKEEGLEWFFPTHVALFDEDAALATVFRLRFGI